MAVLIVELTRWEFVSEKMSFLFVTPILQAISMGAELVVCNLEYTLNCHQDGQNMLKFSQFSSFSIQLI